MKIEWLTPHVRIRRLICTHVVSADAARNLRVPFLIANARTTCVPQIAREAHRGSAIQIAEMRGAVHAASLTLTRARWIRGLTVASSLKRFLYVDAAGCLCRGAGRFRREWLPAQRGLPRNVCFSNVQETRTLLMAACKNDRNAQLFLSLRTQCLDRVELSFITSAG